MDPRSLQFVAEACQGRLVRGNGQALVKRVVSDSRKAGPEDLFIALRGEKWDGHQFVPDVVRQGASGVVVEEGDWSQISEACAVVEVKDTRRALGYLGRRYRQDLPAIRIAVAGSNGKTTTKDLAGSVLQRRFATLWSEASFNNDLGVPFTLLRLEARHQAAVFELGTNHPGELAPLVDLVAPRYGLLTSIGREHLEFFHDLAGVAAEEGALAEHLPSDGVLFLNGDSEWTRVVEQRARCRVVRAGWNDSCQWQATSLRMDAAGTTFTLGKSPEGFGGSYHISLLGRHQVTHAMLVAALACELGLSAEEIRSGLSSCAPPKSRLVLENLGGVGVLDDSYNANADSMLAALQTLQDLPCTGKRVAILGDMAELGIHAEEAHAEVGAAAGRHGVNVLIAVGRFASITWEAAQRAGMSQGATVATAAEAIEHAQSVLRRGDLVLIKASRAAGLDHIAFALKEALGTAR